MLLLIDNYDSFTWNLYQYFCELGAEVVVKRNDDITLAQIAALAPAKLVISPGPLHADRGRHLACRHCAFCRTAADPWGLPRPSGHCPGVWRCNYPRRPGDARQNFCYFPQRQRRIQRPE